MSGGIKAIHILIAFAVCAVAFGAGVFALRSGKEVSPTLHKPAAPLPFNAPQAEVAEQPAADLPTKKAESPVARAAAKSATVPAGTTVVKGIAGATIPGAVRFDAAGGKSPWTLTTIWGLPKPRKLGAKEKEALKLLGGARDKPQFKFSRVELDDGSTIPGTPSMDADDVSKRVLDKVKSMGMADGFEAVILELAPHNLNHLMLPVDKTPPWTELSKILGKPDSSHEGDLWFTETPVRVNAYYRLTWHQYGWLYFGEGKDLVRAVKADMFKVEVVPAESIPGGRSLPDPAKVEARKKKAKPSGPREQNALRLLGQAGDVRVTARKAVKKDPNLDALFQVADNLKGKDLYPNMIETARKLKESRQSDYLIVVPSNVCTIEEINKVMGETNVTNTDTNTIPGQTVTWHRHFWLEFGVVGGQVKRVRISCAFVPNSGV